MSANLYKFSEMVSTQSLTFNMSAAICYCNTSVGLDMDKKVAELLKLTGNYDPDQQYMAIR